MVNYTQWTGVVHDVYKSMGGDYGAQGVVQAITRAAAEWWNENKETIIELAVDGARRLARELIREYIQERGQFP